LAYSYDSAFSEVGLKLNYGCSSVVAIFRKFSWQ